MIQKEGESMADLLARFKIIDEISDKLGAMAEKGQSMAEQLENIGNTGNIVFSGITGKVRSAISTIDGVASSLDSLQGAVDSVAVSADSFSDTMNEYGNVTGESVDQAKEWTDILAAQEKAMEQYKQATEELSSSIEKTCETEEKLSEAMEKASQISKELADNDKVSIETKEELARASQEAEVSMRNLAAAQQEAEAAMTEYEHVLASGTQNLDELERAAQRVSEASDTLNEANQRAANATDELAHSTQQAADEAENSSKKSQDAVENLASALTAAGIATLVLEMVDAFMKASEAAGEFEVATMKISTIADTTQVSLSQISSDIMNLSRDTGISVTGLSEAAYSALSASVNTADAVKFTATASKLAAGGFTSSATAVDVLTTALNAYGLQASYAGRISDMLITTQNLGKTTVDELAASVGKVIPLASAYGVEMDNLSAAYAELTKGGIATAEAGTYLKSMLNELGDSGSAVSAVLLEQTGNSFSQLMEQGYSLGDVMAVLGESVNGNAGAFNELWSSSEAGIGALSLYNAGADQFNSTLNAMQSSIGATESAYSTMTDTTVHSQEELANAANNLQISIGQNINPLIEKLYGLGTNILNGMTRFSQEHPVVTKAISAISIGLGVAGVAMVGVTTATTVAIPAVISFGAALNAALGPIGWVTIGITTLLAAGAALISMFEKAEDETAGMTATTREQYYELQDLNTEYEEACKKYGETSEEASRLKYQVDDLSMSFETNRQTVEEFTAEANALCESVTQMQADFNDGMSAIKNSEVGSFSLIQKYEDLATQAELTGAQQKELEAVTKKLSESYPELAAQMDSATLSTEGYAEAMKRACEQEAEEQRQQQAQDTYIEALEKRAVLIDEIAKAQENLNLEQAKMDNMSGWDHFWTTGEWDDIKAYQAALDELNAAMKDNDATIAKIEQSWENLAEAEEEAADVTISWEETVSAAYENVREHIEELCTAYDETYEAALESFSGQFGLFEQASMKSEDYTNSTVANAQKALNSQLAYWENYNANLQTLIEYGESLTGEVREQYAALLAYAQDGSEEAAGLANSMAKAIQNGDTAAIEALSNTVAEVSAQQEAAAASTADFVTDFSSQMDVLEQEMHTTIQEMDLSDEAAASATSTITAYANQIKAGKDGAVAAAEEVAKAVTLALSSANTTANIKVNSATSVPGHANGTTSAESVFLAGEEGPELVARPAATYATGTTNSTDYFIAGEDGPELIIGEQGSTVFPTSETDRLINALNGNKQPLEIQMKGDKISNNERPTEQVKHILLELAGSGTIEVEGNNGTDKATILEVLSEYIKPVLMNIIQSEIYEEGELSYEY